MIDQLDEIQAWEEIVGRIEIKYPFPLTAKMLTPLESPLSSPAVRISIRVPHRDTGEMVEVSQDVTLHTKPDEQRIFDLLSQMVMHELRESFYFEGKRIYDPHA